MPEEIEKKPTKASRGSESDIQKGETPNQASEKRKAPPDRRKTASASQGRRKAKTEQRKEARPTTERRKSTTTRRKTTPERRQSTTKKPAAKKAADTTAPLPDTKAVKKQPAKKPGPSSKKTAQKKPGEKPDSSSERAAPKKASSLGKIASVKPAAENVTVSYSSAGAESAKEKKPSDEIQPPVQPEEEELQPEQHKKRPSKKRKANPDEDISPRWVGPIIRWGILLLVLAGLGATFYYFSNKNSGKFFLKSGKNLLAVRKGIFFPFGSKEYVPDNPEDKAFYKPIKIREGALSPGTQVFTKLTQLHDRFFGLLHDLSREEIYNPSSNDFTLARIYLERANKIPGLPTSKVKSLNRLTGDLAYRQGRKALLASEERLKNAQRHFKKANDYGTTRFKDTARQVLFIQRLMLHFEKRPLMSGRILLKNTLPAVIEKDAAHAPRRPPQGRKGKGLSRQETGPSGPAPLNKGAEPALKAKTKGPAAKTTALSLEDYLGPLKEPAKTKSTGPNKIDSSPGPKSSPPSRKKAPDAGRSRQKPPGNSAKSKKPVQSKAVMHLQQPAPLRPVPPVRKPGAEQVRTPLFLKMGRRKKGKLPALLPLSGNRGKEGAVRVISALAHSRKKTPPRKSSYPPASGRARKKNNRPKTPFSLPGKHPPSPSRASTERLIQL